MYYTKFNWSDYGFVNGVLNYDFNGFLSSNPDCPEYIKVSKWSDNDNKIYYPIDYDEEIENYTQVEYSYRNDHFILIFSYFNFDKNDIEWYNKNKYNNPNYYIIDYILNMNINEFILIEKIISIYKGSGYRAMINLKNDWIQLPIFVKAESPYYHINDDNTNLNKEDNIIKLVNYFEDLGFYEVSKDIRNYYKKEKYPLMMFN